MKHIILTIIAAMQCVVLAGAETSPNVILILADDLGAKDLSCYGSKKHQTPNLDRMAAEGTRFETFYAMPLCTPLILRKLTSAIILRMPI
jgi:Sulfatase